MSAEMTVLLMVSILSDPLPTALLRNHPNSLEHFHFTDNNWIQLVRAYNEPQCQSQDHDLPHSIRRLQLDRTPILIRS